MGEQLKSKNILTIDENCSLIFTFLLVNHGGESYLTFTMTDSIISNRLENNRHFHIHLVRDTAWQSENWAIKKKPTLFQHICLQMCVGNKICISETIFNS